MAATNPDHVKACLQETKDQLQEILATSDDYRLKNCLANLEKLEALMKGDYETVWRCEAEQRQRDAEFHRRTQKNLVRIQNERINALRVCSRLSCFPPAPAPTATSSPLLAALLAMQKDTPTAAAAPAAAAAAEEAYDDELYS